MYSDYEIVEPQSPPLWVYHLPALKRVWDNPISQKLYKPIKYRFIPPPVMGFLSAFALSLFLNIVFQSEPFKESAPIAGLTLSVGVSSAAVAFYATIRIIVSALGANPIRIRDLIENRTIDSWLSLPLNDKTLFHSLNFPSLMGALKVYENMVAVMVGLVIPFLIISFKNGIFVGQIFLSADILSTKPASMAVWVVLMPLILAIHLTLATGLYALLMNRTHAVLAALVHFAVCVGFTSLARMTWFAIFPGDRLTDMPMVILGELVCALILLGLAKLTGMVGVMVFARFRRPGFNEEEWASAAGLPQYSN